MAVVCPKLRCLLIGFSITCIVFVFCLSPAFGTDKKVKRYTMKSGEVHYKIEGSGDIMGMKMSSSGKKSLYFRDYGGLMLQEEIQKKTTTGLGKNTEETTHSMTKTDQLNIYKVSFDQKKIFVSSDFAAAAYLGKNMGDEAEKILTGFGGKKIGSDNVLGYSCTVWSVMGGKQCLYKNQVPLWMEVDIMGVKTRETAVSAKFNHRISDKHFTLPSYPVEKGLEGAGQMSAEDAEQMAAMMQAIGQVAQEAGKSMQDNPNMSEKDLEQQVLSALSQTPQMNSELKKMQRNMPIMLKLAREYRKCLKRADNKNQAQICGDRAEQKSRKLGLPYDSQDQDEKIMSWSPQDKKKALDDMDESIADMEKAMPCIQKAANFMDLMNCPGFSE